MNNNAKAVAKYVRSSPHKVRRVLDQIRGRSFQEASMILEVLPYRCCSYILKTLKSAVANAENNYNLPRRDLITSHAIYQLFREYQGSKT